MTKTNKISGLNGLVIGEDVFRGDLLSSLILFVCVIVKTNTVTLGLRTLFFENKLYQS